MEDLILILMALTALELAVLMGVTVWRTVFGVKEKKGPEDPGPEKAEPEEKDESEEYERRWRDGVRAMMGYDGRPAGRDEDEN